MGDILPCLIPSGLPHPHCSNFCIKLKSNIKFYVVVCSIFNHCGWFWRLPCLLLAVVLVRKLVCNWCVILGTYAPKKTAIFHWISFFWCVKCIIFSLYYRNFHTRWWYIYDTKKWKNFSYSYFFTHFTHQIIKNGYISKKKMVRKVKIYTPTYAPNAPNHAPKKDKSLFE